MEKSSSVVLWSLNAPHKGRAKDGSLSAAEGLAAVDSVVGHRIAWPQSLAAVADSRGNRVCPRPADGHSVVAGRQDQRRLH